MTSIIILTASVLGAVIVWYVRRRHLRLLPDTSDAQFGEYLHSRFGISPSDAIAERLEISRLIGVPREKLAPDTRLRDLTSGPLDSTEIGLTDLGFDVGSLADRHTVRDRIRMPETVAGVVQLRIKLKTGQF